MIPFSFWKPKLIVSIFNDEDFSLILIENDSSTGRFIFREFRDDDIRIDVERFRTVEFKFLEERVSLLIRNIGVIFKFKDRVDIIIPSFLSVETESGLLFFLLRWKIDKEFSDNGFIDLEFSLIVWFSLTHLL